jgi:hypothetical protein
MLVGKERSLKNTYAFKSEIPSRIAWLKSHCDFKVTKIPFGRRKKGIAGVFISALTAELVPAVFSPESHRL